MVGSTTANGSDGAGIALPVACVPDSADHSGKAVVNVLAADSQEEQPSGLDHSIAFPIIARLSLVNAAVYFDNEASAMAVEIGDEAVDHLLTPKRRPIPSRAA
jgi:hypothetical protein